MKTRCYFALKLERLPTPSTAPRLLTCRKTAYSRVRKMLKCCPTKSERPNCNSWSKTSTQTCLMVRINAIGDEQLRDEVKNEVKSVTDFFATVWFSFSLVVTFNCLNWPGIRSILSQGSYVQWFCPICLFSVKLCPYLTPHSRITHPKGQKSTVTMTVYLTKIVWEFILTKIFSYLCMVPDNF